MQSEVASSHFVLTVLLPHFALTVPRLASPHFMSLSSHPWPRIYLDRSLAKLIDPRPQHIFSPLGGFICSLNVLVSKLSEILLDCIHFFPTGLKYSKMTLTFSKFGSSFLKSSQAIPNYHLFIFPLFSLSNCTRIP